MKSSLASLPHRSAGTILGLLLAAMLAAIAPGPASASAPLYHAGFYAYPTGIEPYSVAAADLNADGRTDAALACWGSDCISVVLAHADGSYGPAVNIPVGYRPRSIAAVDMNGDGAPDLVACGEGSSMWVLLNNGAGVFTQSDAKATGPFPFALAAGDLNGDGHADVVTANYYGNCMSVFLRTTPGVVSTRVDYVNGVYNEGVALGDLNHDGFLDAVMVGNKRSVFLGHGDGTFDLPLMTNTLEHGVALGDMDEDGNLDIVMFTGDGLGIYAGNGAGGFSTVSTGKSSSSQVGAFSLGDVNADGHLDLIVTHSGGGGGAAIGVYMGDGHGHLSNEHLLLSLLQPNGVALAPLVTGGPLGALVAGQGANALGVHPGNGDSTFSAWPSFPIPDGVQELVTARVNGDLSPDLLGWYPSTDYRSFFWSSYQGGQNFFGGGNPVPGHSASGMAVGDLNGDGWPDVVISNGTAYPATRLTVQVFLSHGNGTFAPEVDVPISTFAYDHSPRTLVLGDFNEDGKLDLAVMRSASGTIALLLGNGAGGFGPATTLAGPWWARRLRTGDIDHDGHLDLLGLIDGNPSVIWTLRGDGTGAFGAITLTNVLPVPNDFVVGDLNGDLRDDIAVCADNGGVLTMLSTGAGNFLTEHSIQLSYGARDIAISDIDRDGIADVVVEHGTTLVAVLRGQGDGGFAERQDFGGGGLLAPPVDLNGDGYPDLVFGGASASGSNSGTVLMSNFGPLAVEPPAAAGVRAGVTLSATPNPVAAFATLRWALPSAHSATLRIVDIAGRELARLNDGPAAAGSHATSWDLRAADGARVAPGIYFAELRAGSRHETKRLVVIR